MNPKAIPHILDTLDEVNRDIDYVGQLYDILENCPEMIKVRRYVNKFALKQVISVIFHHLFYLGAIFILRKGVLRLF